MIVLILLVAITFSGKTPVLSFMSAPLLKDDFGVVATSVVRKTQTLGEIIFHEFSHYFSVAMEGRFYGNLQNVSDILFQVGFSRDYLRGMEKRWTNAEEIRAIIGLLVRPGGTIFYDHLNESEFNLVGRGEDVRISHCDFVFTKVPYLLLEFIEAGRKEDLTSVRSQIANYDSVLDSI